MSEPIKSQRIQQVIETSYSAQSIARVQPQRFAKFFISHDLFIDITANARFPTLPEEELADLRGKNHAKTHSRVQKLCWMLSSSIKVQRNEARKLEDVPRHELEIRKKDGHEYKPESLTVMQCSLDRHLKNCGRNYSILWGREFANSRQQLETKAR